MTLMRILWLAAACALSACAHTPIDDPADPLEPVNRKVFAFNEQLDKYIARPVARAYVKTLPQEVRTGVNNFLRNAVYPTTIVNDVLQGKISQAGRDSGRFLLNTTFGLAGVLDPATMVGLTRNEEDFGQTFGAWGIGPGWYLMVPFMGPSSNRDLVGKVANTVTNPWTYADDNVRLLETGADLIDTRSQLLGTERVLAQQFDRYLFVRGAYLQRRQNLVYDGNPPKEEIDWGDEDEDVTPPAKPAEKKP
jgi:phospholipid-binding lipoprotein MlaA